MRPIGRQSDYRQLLREELATRCQANPRYSQGAFARDLGLRPNRLCEVLNGKQGMSRVVAAAVASRLGYNASEREYFCDLVDSLHARSPTRRTQATAKVRAEEPPHAANRLAEDKFAVIADWHHMAILELASVRGFRGDKNTLAACLDIPESVAETAVDRLLGLGLLRRVHGRLVAANATDEALGGTPSEARRRFHSQVLAKAQTALVMQDHAGREFMTAFVGVQRDRVPEAKRLVQSYVEDFCRRMGEAQPSDALYSFGIQFFQLSDPQQLSTLKTNAQEDSSWEDFK